MEDIIFVWQHNYMLAVTRNKQNPTLVTFHTSLALYRMSLSHPCRHAVLIVVSQARSHYSCKPGHSLAQQPNHFISLKNSDLKWITSTSQFFKLS